MTRARRSQIQRAETIGLLLVGLIIAGAGFYFYVDAQQSAASAVVPRSAARAFAGATQGAPPPMAAQSFVPPTWGTAPQAFAGTTTLPTPREQGAGDKVLVEGHWHGMELLELTPSLARINNINPSQRGLLVDEVSLQAAASGMRAGDVVASIGQMWVASLPDFREATFAVRNQPAVNIGLVRSGQPLAVVLRVPRALGFAMFEAASPIAPGALSPHKDRGRACTDCHIIMDKGGQLAIDAGDLLPTPPPIVQGTPSPHGNRGPCNTCHTVVPAGP